MTQDALALFFLIYFCVGGVVFSWFLFWIVIPRLRDKE